MPQLPLPSFYPPPPASFLLTLLGLIVSCHPHFVFIASTHQDVTVLKVQGIPQSWQCGTTVNVRRLTVDTHTLLNKEGSVLPQVLAASGRWCLSWRVWEEEMHKESKGGGGFLVNEQLPSRCSPSNSNTPRHLVETQMWAPPRPDQYFFYIV